MTHIALLATGDELVLGHVADLNLHWLAKLLHDRHHHVKTHVICGDDRDDIGAHLQSLCQHHDVVIMTGGLGPTSDDVTREVIANHLKTPLIYHQSVYDRSQGGSFSSDAPKSNLYLRQFSFPKHAVLFENCCGTAWGFACVDQSQCTKQCWIYALPGPPQELQPMFLNEVWPHFVLHHRPKQHHHLQWHVQDLAESVLHDELMAVFNNRSIPIHICANKDRHCHVYIYLDVQSYDGIQCKRIMAQVSNVLSSLDAIFIENHTLLEN